MVAKLSLNVRVRAIIRVASPNLRVASPKLNPNPNPNTNPNLEP